MDGQFVPGGCCLLDFYWLWTWQAMHQSKDPDAAYAHARRLAHSVLAIVEAAPTLHVVEGEEQDWQRRLNWYRGRS